MAFNGYIVTFYNHEQCIIDTDTYDTEEDVMAVGFEELPDAETLVDDAYDVYGDTVGKVTDRDGTVLYDKMAEMEAIQNMFGD